MERKEKAEELLETLWIRTEEGKEDSLSLADLSKGERATIEQLAKSGQVTMSANKARLTTRGQMEAKNVVRRHRLAERLLADVLGTADTIMHEKACKFEHLLDHGLDDSICTLLGHPKICPHGKPIPPGRCCLDDERQPHKVVSPLSQLEQGQKGKVAYIYSSESSQLQKLMAMGILPGAVVTLVQSFPSYTFQTGQSQFAVDKEIADSIYIRLIGDEEASQAGDELSGRVPGRRRERQRLSLWGRRRK